MQICIVFVVWLAYRQTCSYWDENKWLSVKSPTKTYEQTWKSHSTKLTLMRCIIYVSYEYWSLYIFTPRMCVNIITFSPWQWVSFLHVNLYIAGSLIMSEQTANHHHHLLWLNQESNIWSTSYYVPIYSILSFFLEWFKNTLLCLAQ